MQEDNTINLRAVFVLPFVFFAGLFCVVPARADYAEDLKNEVETASPDEGAASSAVKPVSKITLRGYYYSGYSQEPFYCFENTEGRCLDKQYDQYTTVEGYGHIEKTFFAYYRTEVNEDGRLVLKKGYGLLRAGIWSFEAGKDTVWIGPGYHGSFLLSNNAEGFLLARIRTEDPFRLPWCLSKIGEFKYDIFRGWSDNSTLLGQRLSWRPVPLLEIGANQVVYIARGKNYSVYQYPHVFFSAQENSGFQTNPYDNDQKASIDVALDMPFLSTISPFVNGRIYYEYAGNDSYAAWQEEDKTQFRKEPTWKRIRWPFSFDFLGIAWMSGLFLTTGDLDFRFEYAQNYRSYPLFYDLYHEYGADRRQGAWYSNLNVRKGLIMGHEMGNDAEDLFYQIVVRRLPLVVQINYDRQKHWLPDRWTGDHPYETRYQYGLRPSYQFKAFTLFADLIYNDYHNVNFSTDPTRYDIHEGTRRNELIAGLGVEFKL